MTGGGMIGLGVVIYDWGWYDRTGGGMIGLG